MGITITKSSGRQEAFEQRKLYASLIRSGAPADVALDIARKVEGKMPDQSSTREIYRFARRLLRQHNLASVMRYSLKKAIFSLGPSGYPFEKYIGRVLAAHGYATETGKVVKGFCVSHEVDVVARNGTEHALIECKYHSEAGKATDVKVALYVHSRFLDIRKAFEADPRENGSVHQCWLVTNTRCTTDAIRYAECTGIRIVSWRYPQTGSLEKLIEEKRLYPVTILPSAKKSTVDSLFRHGFVLAQDIADMDQEGFRRTSGLERQISHALKQEADELCPCQPS
ncbi:MAG: hypothetical protein OHK006_15900 [Thermodesulfovibrionales bacterium]